MIISIMKVGQDYKEDVQTKVELEARSNQIVFGAVQGSAINGNSDIVVRYTMEPIDYYKLKEAYEITCPSCGREITEFTNDNYPDFECCNTTN